MDGMLGTNAVYIDVDEAVEMDLKRIEFCLGGMDGIEEKLSCILEGMAAAEKFKVAYSIHLPIFLPEWYGHYFLDAYYLDPDPAKRELSFRLLEYNLERLEGSSCEYFVIHFPGIYSAEDYMETDFGEILAESLERLDSIAGRSGSKIMLEYFGSNELFSGVRQWQSEVGKHGSLGILLDTGHLYFASMMRGFDFMESLGILSETAEAFHLWTTRGRGAYCSNQAYLKYRHIPLCSGQRKTEGWAFDSDCVMEIVSRRAKPAVMEASCDYGGKSLIKDGIESLKKYYRIK